MVLLVVVGCGGGSKPATDATTAKLASAEAAQLCDVRTANARTEADLHAGLVRHLKDAGVDEATWRTWHDSLATSSPRAAELAAATKRPCPTR